MVHAVRRDTGERISGTPFRELIPALATDGAFSCHSALIQPHRLVIPHTHTKEHEFSFVFRGQLGARIGDDDLLVEEGGFLFQPQNVLHALWNPTDVEVVLLVFITPPSFEGFFREMGALGPSAAPNTVHDICSMRISADVRAYAETHGLTSLEAIEAGMADKSEQFVALGSSVYLPAPRRGALT